MGYVYYQLNGDNGSGATLGDFKARVAGIGPQAGYLFEAWDRQWYVYVNAKAYYELAAQNQAEGWNVWLSLAIPLNPPRR